tara:strand:- start:3085 stop:5037 length:1953 start_codon:yes stop_codon:yes gene_type:complete
MAYITFDHNELVNLKYSLDREIVKTNRFGGYASSTLVNCHTRKYHGLLVVPQPQIDHEKHVLLSSLDEVIVTDEGSFNLGIHKYPEQYHPKGHKYLSGYTIAPIPQWSYRVGDIKFTKGIIFESKAHRVLIKYKVDEASKPFKIRLHPFLAFRNFHALSKANVFINTRYQEDETSIQFHPYSGYTPIHFQLTAPYNYVHAPDWYYNIEYDKERERGYPYQEDLWVPGYFEVELKAGDEFVISAGLEPRSIRGLKTQYTKELKKRTIIDSFQAALTNAAQQLIEKNESGTRVCAGLHWFGSWGRDTFIALPGLTLPFDKTDVFKDVIKTQLKDLKNGLFPNIGYGENAAYNAVDASLWFIWSLQQLAAHTGKKHKVWKKYKKPIQEILYAYKNGTENNIHMTDEGLIWAGEAGKALTWMDAVVHGHPVTQREGMPVEINALWYNAVCFALSLTDDDEDEQFLEDFEHLPYLIKQSFIQHFWIDEEGYLADVITPNGRDTSMRPNQIFACSLPHNMLSDEMKAMILEQVKTQLLTPRGLRTLSPRHAAYKGVNQGDQSTRDNAYHQGTVWVWLFGHFAEAWLNLYKCQGIDFIKKWLTDFEPHIKEAGIGTVSEIFDGDPPNRPKGTISQAWSISELLRVHQIIQQLEEDET